jgi:signal transduction histidine kinase
LDELAREGAQHDPYAELDVQNRELLQAMEDLRRRQEELVQVNRELEDTNRGVVALYAELDEKAEYLRHADLLKSTFLSHMSHEFRTPLNSIMALSKILEDRLDGPLTDEQTKQVSFIHRAAQELTSMVDDLLDLAKVEAGKIDIHVTEFDVTTLLGTLRGMMRPLCTDASVQLIFEDPNILPAMWSDEAKVAQILRNFISNAIKYTERGEIRVTCAYEPAGDMLTFTVSDTGPGIPPEEQEHIFQEYYQINSTRQRKVKGTGLGLPLTRKLAELLGGSIQLRSEVGAGSRFSARLPRAIGEVSVHSAVRRLPAAPAQKSQRVPRVLVIDDEDVARYVVRKLLIGLNAEVEEACSAIEGIEYARERQVDLIVLDLEMPEANGFQVLAALEKEPATRDIPVVIYTSRPIGQPEREALSHARAIVSKSHAEPELREVVESLVASSGK